MNLCQRNSSFHFFQFIYLTYQHFFTNAYVLFQDMDLIEVLWKQDVDLGFTLVEAPTTTTKKASTLEKESDDEIEKLKALEAINGTNEKVCNITLIFVITCSTEPTDLSSISTYILILNFES